MRNVIQQQSEQGVHREIDRLSLLRYAIRERQTIRATYAGRSVTIWPYALGWRREDPYVLGLMIPNDPSGKRPPITVDWYPVRDIGAAAARKSYWIAASVKTALRGRVVDRIEVR